MKKLKKSSSKTRKLQKGGYQDRGVSVPETPQATFMRNYPMTDQQAFQTHAFSPTATGQASYVPIEGAFMPAAKGLGWAGNFLADMATGSMRANAEKSLIKKAGPIKPGWGNLKGAAEDAWTGINDETGKPFILPQFPVDPKSGETTHLYTSKLWKDLWNEKNAMLNGEMDMRSNAALRGPVKGYKTVDVPEGKDLFNNLVRESPKTNMRKSQEASMTEPWSWPIDGPKTPYVPTYQSPGNRFDMLSEWQKGGPIKTDALGYWNKDNLGKRIRIPSGDISMQGVPFPVHGRDNLGNELVMRPGGSYQFPGTSVTETPMLQSGGKVSPVQISDPNEYLRRSRAYNDSSTLYNNNQDLHAQLYNQGYKPIRQDLYDKAKHFPNSIEDAIGRMNNFAKSDPSYKIDLRKESDSLNSVDDFVHGVVNKTLPRQLYSDTIKPAGMMAYRSPRPFSKIDGNGNAGIDERVIADYSNVKPVQPVEYRPEQKSVEKPKFVKPSYQEYVKKVNPDFLGNDYNLEEAYKNLPYKTMKAWQEDPQKNHLPDTYKLPNHPTFSNESKYYKEGMKAVKWEGDTPVPINQSSTPVPIPQRSVQSIMMSGTDEKGNVIRLTKDQFIKQYGQDNWDKNYGKDKSNMKMGGQPCYNCDGQYMKAGGESNNQFPDNIPAQKKNNFLTWLRDTSIDKLQDDLQDQATQDVREHLQRYQSDPYGNAKFPARLDQDNINLDDQDQPYNMDVENSNMNGDHGYWYDKSSDNDGDNDEMKKGGGFKLNPAHKGFCSPMTKSTCYGKRRQFAINAKNHFKKQQMGGIPNGGYSMTTAYNPGDPDNPNFTGPRNNPNAYYDNTQVNLPQVVPPFNSNAWPMDPNEQGPSTPDTRQDVFNREFHDLGQRAQVVNQGYPKSDTWQQKPGFFDKLASHWYGNPDIWNLGMDTATSVLNSFDRKKHEQWLRKQTAADSWNMPIASNRGDYDTNSGRLRPDQMTPVQFSGNVGLYAQGGQYKAGGSYYMSDDEIARLKAAGYDLEVQD